MKHLVLFLLLILGGSASTQAQVSSDNDSLLFSVQRERVNQLLEERRQRFGDFDQSLRKKTGAFGIFKRKKDMQQSIDILRDIVLTDNEIFLETKKLLDIKCYESDRNEHLASEYDKQISAYMHTITKLQTENERLRSQIDELGNHQNKSNTIVYVLSFALLVSGVAFYRYTRRVKQKNLTQD